MPEAGKSTAHEHSRPVSTWTAHAVPGLIPQEDGLELLYVRSEGSPEAHLLEHMIPRW